VHAEQDVRAQARGDLQRAAARAAAGGGQLGPLCRPQQRSQCTRATRLAAPHACRATCTRRSTRARWKVGSAAPLSRQIHQPPQSGLAEHLAGRRSGQHAAPRPVRPPRQAVPHGASAGRPRPTLNQNATAATTLLGGGSGWLPTPSRAAAAAAGDENVDGNVGKGLMTQRQEVGRAAPPHPAPHPPAPFRPHRGRLLALSRHGSASRHPPRPEAAAPRPRAAAPLPAALPPPACRFPAEQQGRHALPGGDHRDGRRPHRGGHLRAQPGWQGQACKGARLPCPGRWPCRRTGRPPQLHGAAPPQRRSQQQLRPGSRGCWGPSWRVAPAGGSKLRCTCRPRRRLHTYPAPAPAGGGGGAPAAAAAAAAV
jgi:hypothetical protein